MSRSSITASCQLLAKLIKLQIWTTASTLSTVILDQHGKETNSRMLLPKRPTHLMSLLQDQTPTMRAARSHKLSPSTSLAFHARATIPLDTSLLQILTKVDQGEVEALPLANETLPVKKP